MKTASFTEDIVFNESQIDISVILQTPFSKEIRILLKKGQIMKEHKAPFPIIVHLLKGEISFGINGVDHYLKEGAILTLDAKVSHNLVAIEDAIIRLTISKWDQEERVQNVAKDLT